MSRDLVGENRRHEGTLQGSGRAGAKQSPISACFRGRAHYGGFLVSFFEPFFAKVAGDLEGFARSREASAFLLRL